MSPEDILACCVEHLKITPFVRKYGELFTAQKLPAKYRSGTWRQCFANSFRMAIRHGVTYVEGYAVSDGHAHLHAWCCDQNKMVLDRTWKNGEAYLGIPFKTEYLKAVINERSRRAVDDVYFGLLEDWESGYPLINLHGNQPELWLAGTKHNKPSRRPS